jgi:hypothetical protein
MSISVPASKVKMNYSSHPRLALRAISYADVRSGILPPQSGSPLRGVRNDVELPNTCASLDRRRQPFGDGRIFQAKS